jgi:hypothetical protein
VSPRRAVAALLLVPPLLALAGCGTDHGQAKALTACHTFSSATSAGGGGLTGTERTAKLAEAADWAAKASRQSPQWDLLHTSLAQYAKASTQAALPAATQSALRDARKVIDSSCEIAARGY